jgi:hypothetical protein
MTQWPIRFMLYGAGDAVNGMGALDTEIQAQLSSLIRVATNPYVVAVAQLDSSSTPSTRYVLDPFGRQPISQFREVNTGDPAELLDFVQWSATLCPARRSVLILSGHGMAWEDEMAQNVVATRGLKPAATAVKSIPHARHHSRRLFGRNLSKTTAMTRAVLIDGTSRDYLSNAELGSVCYRIASMLGDKLDVLVFDACLMSSWELLQELSGSVKTVVASVDELSASGVDLARPAYAFSTNGGEVEPKQMAATFAAYFTPRANFDSCIAIDLSGQEWASALAHFRIFANNLLPWLQASPNHAEAARGALKHAATSLAKFTSGGLGDVAALASAITAIPQIPGASAQSINAVVAALRSCILGRNVGRDYQSALGVSVFSPDSASVYKTNRSDYLRLQFPNASGWGPVLEVLHGSETTPRLTPTSGGGNSASYPQASI